MSSLGQLAIAKIAEILKLFPENEIVINSAQDFAVQDSTTITLESDFLYTIGVSFNTTKRFTVQPNVVMRGTVDITIAYLGTGVMFTSTQSGGFFVNQLRFISITASEIFNFSNVSPGVSSFVLDKVVVSKAQKFGTLDQVAVIILDEVVSEDIDDGITLDGSITSLIVRTLEMETTSAAFVGLDLGTAVISGVFNINEFTVLGVAGSVGMSGLTGSGNIGTSIIASINGANFPAPMTPLVNLSESDLRLEFFNSSPIPDSTKTADSFLTASRTVPIATSGVFVGIAGTDWSSDILERFSSTNTGILTYLSPVSTKAQVIATATVEKVGGGSNLIEMKVAINGTIVNKTVGATDNTQPTQVTSQGLFTLNTNDTIQAFVANQDTSVDIIVSNANLSVINGF